VSPEPPPVPGGRSSDEREAARRARAERRVGKGSEGTRGARAPKGAGGRAPTPVVDRAGSNGAPAAAPRAIAAEPAHPPLPDHSRKPPGRHVRPPRPGESRPGRGRRRGRVAVLAGACVLGLLVAYVVLSYFQPFAGEGEGSVRVTIPRGAGVGRIAEILDERGVVPSALFFSARATLGGRRGDLKPGSYTLREGMSYAAALDALAAGPPRNIVTLSVIEGQARPEIAASLKDAGLEGDYLAATRRSPRLNLARYDAQSARDLEGFLFPATYELRRGSSVRDLVEKQLEAFTRQFAQVDLSAARRKNLTAYDVLIIASMVEREAQLDSERPMIASVIYNRLSRGEPLGIDATTRFETGNFTKPLTASVLEQDTPYNTRTNQGLPPGPIGNPGIESIKAAARPAQTNFLFYVRKPCVQGEHAFSETLEEFEADAARYNAERERLGGRSPEDC